MARFLHTATCALALLLCAFAIPRATAEDEPILSPPTEAGAHNEYCEILSKSLLFYRSQRSENKLTGDAQDLFGGYFDDDGGTKSTLPMASSMTLMAWSLIEFGDAVVACGLYEEYIDTLKWGSNYIMRAHPQENILVAQVGPSIVGKPTLVYAVSPARPGSDLAMNAASALASLAVLMKNRDADYTALLVRHAKELYSFAYTYPGTYSESIPEITNYKSFTYETDLVWGATWLYRATGQAHYLANAKHDYKRFLVANAATCQTLDWTHKGPGVIMNMYKITGDSDYLKDAAQWFASWLPGTCITYTPGGLAYARDQGTLRVTSGAAFIALLMNNDVSKSWGENQIQYMLGRNPASYSFMVGHGPEKVPLSRRSALIGAISGTPGRSDELLGQNTVVEPAGIEHNAGFTAAVVSLARLGLSKSSLATARQSFRRPQYRDLSRTAAAAAPARAVRPRSTDSQFSLQTHPGASANWFSVVLDAGVAGLTIESVTITDSSVDAKPQSLNFVEWDKPYWTISPSAPIVAPLTLTITSSAGKTISLTLTEIRADTTLYLGSQF